VELGDELAAIASAAAAYADAGEDVTGVLAAEPIRGERIYLCAFGGEDTRSWLALDRSGDPVRDRSLVRETVAIAAMCEIAEESAGGGDVQQLRTQLLTLRLTEAPVGIEEAEEAALELEQTLGTTPRVASAAYLDAVGNATRRLERALGETGQSPFGVVMQNAIGAIDQLAADVERHYKLELSGVGSPKPRERGAAGSAGAGSG
jgi:hypothetical protein